MILDYIKHARLVGAGRSAEAEELCKKMLEARPDNAYCLDWLAQRYFDEENDHAKAEDIAQSMVDLACPTFTTWRILAFAAFRHGDFDKCRLYAEELLKASESPSFHGPRAKGIFANWWNRLPLARQYNAMRHKEYTDRSRWVEWARDVLKT